jgi:hypothetical protein
MATFTQRMLGAATYEEVEHDTGATGQAAGVVVLSSLAVGIGSIIHAGFWSGLVLGTVAAG